MIVLDTSAVFEMARETERGKALRSMMEPEEEIIAPSQFVAESTNVAWKYVHAGILNKNDACALWNKTLNIPDRIIQNELLIDEAFSQAIHLDHSVYDILYLVLARRTNATLMTLDQKLSVLAGQCGVSCITEIEL